MNRIITAFTGRTGEALSATALVVAGLALATGIVAMAVAGPKAERLGHALFDVRSDPDAVALERYFQRGGAIQGYEVVY